MSRRLNLHIFLSNLESETRLFKEARYTLDNHIFDQVVATALWAEGLVSEERHESGLDIIRIKTLVRQFRKVPTVLSKALAVISIVQYTLACLLKAHALKASHISCHNLIALPVAWAAAKASGAQLVYVPHELETERQGLGGFTKRLHSWIEKKFIHSAAQIVVVCDPIAEWYRNAYNLTNVHVVRNVPEKSVLSFHTPAQGTFRQKFRIPETATVFIYQGLFGTARGTDMLIDIFSDLDPMRHHLIFMGYGDTATQFEVEAAVHRITNIHYQAAVPRHQITSYTAGADVGILVSEHTSLSYRYALPNKFYEYTHAGLPVMVTDNFEYLSSIVTEEELGWITAPNELGKTIDAIKLDKARSMKSHVQTYVSDAVWEKDAQEFAKVYR